MWSETHSSSSEAKLNIWIPSREGYKKKSSVIRHISHICGKVHQYAIDFLYFWTFVFLVGRKCRRKLTYGRFLVILIGLFLTHGVIRQPHKMNKLLTFTLNVLCECNLASELYQEIIKSQMWFTFVFDSLLLN